MTTTIQTLRSLLITLLTSSLVLNSLIGAEADPSTQRVHESPAWLRSSVAYQIFPRNFSNNGDLNSITERMEELQDLGVNILWLMPINPIGEKMKKGSLGSPYAVSDFYAVNPDLGTAEDLKRLVKTAHKHGMKVVMDIPAGHTSWDNVMMATPEFYRKDADGNIIPPNPAWTDVAALDYENAKLRHYMIDVLKFWEREFDVDGFHCDVAFDVPDDFWKTVRKELTDINPEVILSADADARPSLLVEAFDMDNSWPLLYALNRVMGGLSSADLLKSSWDNTRQQFPKGALHMRFTDTQREVRAVARHGIAGALAGQVFMLSIDGVPLFYNGMEVGDATESADPALFEKLPVFWDPAGRPPLRDIYRSLIKLRRENAAFHNDDVEWLENTEPESVVTIMRQDDTDEFVILVNLSTLTASGSVELANADEFEPVSIDGLPDLSNNPLPDFRLGAYDWRIYHRADSE